MTPKEKAQELKAKFDGLGSRMSKQCALIVAKEVIKEVTKQDYDDTEYWQEVKNEINKL